MWAKLRVERFSKADGDGHYGGRQYPKVNM
jgi:hypothetical protein